MKYPQKIRFTKKSILIGALVAVFLTGGSVFAYQQIRSDKPTDTTDTTPVTEGTEGINLEPATEEEKAQNEQHKEDIVKQQTQPTPPPATGKPKVTPVIVSASVDGVGAYVPGVFEEGGTCTAIFTKGSQSFNRSSAGFQNASYTQCAPIALTRSNFPSAGTWSVVVSYASAKVEGASAATTFTVN